MTMVLMMSALGAFALSSGIAFVAVQHDDEISATEPEMARVAMRGRFVR